MLSSRSCSWNRVTDAAALGFSEFEAMLIYEAEVSDRVLDVLCTVLNRRKSEFLEDLGRNCVEEEIRP